MAEELDSERRTAIYTLIKQHGGLHLRELQRRSGLGLSVTRYHVEYLRRHNFIKEERNKRNVRYYPLSFGSSDITLMNALRQPTPRAIIVLLLNTKNLTTRSLKEKLSLSESTIFEHLKELQQQGIIKQEKKGYEIAIDKERLVNILKAYKQSFLDSIVEQVIDAWEF